MENPEKRIALIENIFGSQYKYNFYFMDKRLIAIDTGIGLARRGSGIGELVNRVRMNKKLKNLKLDEMLQIDKNSYAIAYEDIEQITLHDSQSRWRFCGVEINWHNTQKIFSLDKKRFDQLSNILQSLPALQGKLVKLNRAMEEKEKEYAE